MIAAAVLTHETTGTVKIMFASLGAYGHLYPMMPLAIACADAGQEVVIATGKPFLERLAYNETVPRVGRHRDSARRARSRATAAPTPPRS
jgi:UDP:flavonoid glycosyltransferase YjiC (YdhE family)